MKKATALKTVAMILVLGLLLSCTAFAVSFETYDNGVFSVEVPAEFINKRSSMQGEYQFDTYAAINGTVLIFSAWENKDHISAQDMSESDRKSLVSEFEKGLLGADTSGFTVNPGTTQIKNATLNGYDGIHFKSTFEVTPAGALYTINYSYEGYLFTTKKNVILTAFEGPATSQSLLDSARAALDTLKIKDSIYTKSDEVRDRLFSGVGMHVLRGVIVGLILAAIAYFRNKKRRQKEEAKAQAAREAELERLRAMGYTQQGTTPYAQAPQNNADNYTAAAYPKNPAPNAQEPYISQDTKGEYHNG